jgi:hypothetical protein
MSLASPAISGRNQTAHATGMQIRTARSPPPLWLPIMPRAYGERGTPYLCLDHFPRCASSTPCSASPVRLKPSTTRTIMIPGKTASHGAWVKNC